MLEAERRGPALKSRLVGDAELYKGLLDRESLRAADGVKFTDTLRPHLSRELGVCSSGDCVNSLEREDETSRWSCGLDNLHCS